MKSSSSSRGAVNGIDEIVVGEGGIRKIANRERF